MPELPDLEVFSRNLHRGLAGKRLSIIKLQKGVRLNVPAAKLKNAIEGEQLRKVYREGKELRFAFANKHIIGLHLMLRGKLHWLDKNDPPKYILAILTFDNGKELALTDHQRKASLTLDPPISTVPDALSRQVTERFISTILQSRAAVKNVLLDQKVIRGIGNAYADEILWDARISPFSISNKIPPAKVKALVRSIRQVLKKAQQQIRKAEPGIIGGEIRDFLLVHNPKRKQSPHGSAIKKTTGARKTYYTSEQVVYK
jgi:formamidopyrimidine-DNA glycosylase